MSETTTQETSTGGASRELDAAVAARVMGWTEARVQQDALYRRPEVFGKPPDWQTSDTFRVRAPHYSEDIAAAWEIVAHLHATRGLSLLLEQHRFDESDDDWSVAPGQWSAHFQDACTAGVGSGDTAMLAICHAALSAAARP